MIVVGFYVDVYGYFFSFLFLLYDQMYVFAKRNVCTEKNIYKY